MTTSNNFQNDHETNLEVNEIVLNSPQQDENIYRSYLKISSANVNNVGRYYCAFNESINENDEFEQLVNNFKASSIYVFVNGEIIITNSMENVDLKFNFLDPENLLYDPKEPIIIGKQFEPFVIPCKPTSPQVKVELLNQDGEVIKYLNFENSIGFRIENDDHDGFLRCIGILNEKRKEIQIIFQKGMSCFENTIILKKVYIHIIKQLNHYIYSNRNLSQPIM